jgi:hypothetical protein
MSQHDMSITTTDANAFVDYRAAVNAALQALVSNNSGATEPAVKFPYMLWPDTTADMLKMRNAANTAWIDMFKISTGLQSLLDSKAPGYNSPLTGTTKMEGITMADGGGITDWFDPVLGINSSGITYTQYGVKFLNANMSTQDFVLDYYKEITFTPVMKVGGTGIATYVTRSGAATAIGNRTPFDISVTVATVGAGTGVVSIEGVPQGNAPFRNSTALSVWATGLVGITTENIMGRMVDGIIYLEKMSAGVASALTHANLTANTRFYISGCFS